MGNEPSTKLTLISHKLCPYVQRVAIALAEKSLTFTRVDIDLAAKPDWFLAISPLGKTPVLKVGDTAIFESAVILEIWRIPVRPHCTAPCRSARPRRSPRMDRGQLIDPE